MSAVARLGGRWSRGCAVDGDRRRNKEVQMARELCIVLVDGGWWVE